MKDGIISILLWLAVISLMLSCYYLIKGNYGFANVYVTVFMGNLVLYKLYLGDDK